MKKLHKIPTEEIEELIKKTLDELNDHNGQLNFSSDAARKGIAAVIAKKLKKDKCVVCGTFTEYDEFDHIDKRYFCVEGSGQLCPACYLSM